MTVSFARILLSAVDSVRAHGGRLGAGARKYWRLLSRSLARTLDPVPVEHPAPSAKLPRLDGIDVLVADDARDNRLLFGRMLQASGATVRLVENGVEACEEVERKAPHLVLMDLQMPLMDGCEATRRLREGGLKAPILACTAHARPTDLERCLAAGCDAVVTKPISVATLVQAVSAYARGVAAAAPSGRVSGRVAGV